MKITTRCIPCLLERIRYQTEIENRELGPRIMKECVDILSHDYHPDACSAVVATRVHKRCHDILGYDPYHDIKKKCNKVATSLLPVARDFIDRASDRLEAAIMISIIGNNMDFGIDTEMKDPETIGDNFQTLLEEGMGYSDLEHIRPFLLPGKNIVYFTDNCGEIVFDRLVLEELLDMRVKVVVVVKGEPILTDATMDDAREFEINDVANKVLTTGTFAVGLDMNNIPPDLEKEMENTDLIISKGMANYEAFSEGIYTPIAYFLRTKCIPVARDMGVKTNINVAKLVMPTR